MCKIGLSEREAGGGESSENFFFFLQKKWRARCSAEENRQMEELQFVL